jgi:Uncharacterized protein conserved in bacteria
MNKKLQEFANEAGFILVSCDQEWGGRFGYKIRNDNDYTFAGYESEDEALIGWAEEMFGVDTANALIKHFNTEFPDKRIYKHLKTGGLYELLVHAKFEDSTRDAVVYRSLENGIAWVRAAALFFDGRFELVPDPEVTTPRNVDRVLELIDGWMSSYDHMGTGCSGSARQSEKEWERDRAEIVALLMTGENNG